MTKSMAPTSQPDTVLPIQYLRGIAAMMVVYHHTRGQIPAFEGYLPGSFGTAGVDIFFVISGFIMYVTTAGTTIGAGEFMMRRIIRVAPLYWLLTSLMCLIWIAAPSLFKTLILTPQTFVQSLLFIPHYSLSFPDNIFPLLVPGWTLNFEMFFYAIFALTLLLPKNLRLESLVLVLVGLVIWGIVSSPFDSALLVTYTSPILLEFATGVLLGKLWLDRQNGIFSIAWGIAIFISGWAFLIFNSMSSASKYLDILGATLIVAGSLNSGFLRWRVRSLKVLGDATYAIYLSHIFTLGILRILWPRLFETSGSSLNAIAFAVVAMATCLWVGILVYAYLENPLSRYLRKVYTGKRRTLAST
ncbi:acyltransferase family protein [Hydrogenophaga sp.]|uniref:acyltransferase family protein n=1 Tax=Hydrogenophaga sp. TaxID=1904254 RepID=UPI003F71B40F